MFPLAEIVYVFTCADNNAKYEKPNANIICRPSSLCHCRKICLSLFPPHVERHEWWSQSKSIGWVKWGLAVCVWMDECNFGFTKKQLIWMANTSTSIQLKCTYKQIASHRRRRKFCERVGSCELSDVCVNIRLCCRQGLTTKRSTWHSKYGVLKAVKNLQNLHTL